MMLVSALTIAASFPGWAVAAEPRPATGHVRILYAVPADREFRSDYRQAVEHAAADLRRWLRRELGGWTFRLYRATPEDCRLGEPAGHYARYSWSRVVAGVQHCAPVSSHSMSTVWVIYADVLHECDAPERLGAATTGLTILPRQDLEGLIGNAIVGDCGDRWDLPVTRWIGGLGHELGHALGLPHPPGCEENAPSCDHDALMWAGYAAYPNTYLRDEEKEYLLESPFIGFEGMAAPFTDDPIQPGVTPVRAVHFTELRVRVDALRAAAGLARFDWTDPVLRAGATPVRLAHLLELREALGAAYAAAGRAAPRWTDPAPTGGATPIRAAHLTELRAAVVGLE